MTEEILYNIILSTRIDLNLRYINRENKNATNLFVEELNKQMPVLEWWNEAEFFWGEYHFN